MPYNFDDIRHKLEAAASQAISQGNWGLLDKITRALKLIEDRAPGEDIDTSVDVIVESLGRQLVLGEVPLTADDNSEKQPVPSKPDATIPISEPFADVPGIAYPADEEETTTPQPTEVAPTKSIPQTEPKDEGHNPQLSDATSAAAVEKPASPQTADDTGSGEPTFIGDSFVLQSPVKVPGSADVPPSSRASSEPLQSIERIIDVPAGGDLSTTWAALRELRRQPPMTWQDLGPYVQGLSGLLQELGDIAVQSEEGRRARQEYMLLQTAHDRLRKAQNTQEAAADAFRRGTLDGITFTLREVEKTRSDVAQDIALQQRFASLYNDLLTELDAIERRIAEDRERLAGMQNVLTTIGAQVERKTLVEKLKEIEQLSSQGNTEVAIDKNQEIYEKIKTRRVDTYTLASIDDVVRAIRRKVLNECVREASRLRLESRKFLEQKNLSLAWNRHDLALEFATTPGVSDFPELKEIQAELGLLVKKIVAAEQLEQEAKRDLQAAGELTVTDLEQAEKKLRLIQNADLKFDALAGLSKVKQTASEEWLSHWTLASQRVQEESRSRAEYHQYDQVLSAVGKLRQRIAGSKALADWAGVDLDTLAEELKHFESTLRTEQLAWQHFQEQRAKVLTAEVPTRQGRLDEKWLKRQFSFNEEYFTRFKHEWQALKDELSKNIGASAVLQQVRGRFVQDPADSEIEDLLRPILKDDSFGEEAGRLLQQHRFAVAYGTLLRYFKFPPVIENDEEHLYVGLKRWQQKVERQLSRVQDFAQKGTNDDTTVSLQGMRQEMNDLYQWRQDQSELWRNQQYDKLWSQLEVQLAMVNEGPLRDGFFCILHEVKERWQQQVVAFVRERIIPDMKRPDLLIRQELLSEDVATARRMLEAMKERRILDFEHAGLIYDRLLILEHEVAAGQILGEEGRILPIWTFDRQKLEELIVAVSNRGLNPRQWQSLLIDLEALRSRSSKGSTITTDLAKDLWFLALIYYSVRGTAEEVIALIEDQRKQADWLAVDPLLCTLLTMRYLKPNDHETDHASQIEALITSLEKRGRITTLSQLGEVLEKIQGAWALWMQEEYEEAENQLTLAVQDVEQLCVKAPQFSAALQEAKDWLLKDWRRHACQRLKTAIANYPDQQKTDVFAQLRRVEQTLKMCGNDVKLERRLNKLRSAARDSYDELSQSVYTLLRDTDMDMGNLIKEGNKLREKITIAIGIEASMAALPTTDRYGSQLKDDLDELEGRISEWRNTQRLLMRIKPDLESLFQGDWIWNSRLDMKPRKELDRMRKELMAQKKMLRRSVPRVLDLWLDLVEALDHHCSTIALSYEQIRTRFVDDRMIYSADFDDLRQTIGQLSNEIQVAEDNIKTRLAKLGDPIRIEFRHKHIKLYNSHPPSTVSGKNEVFLPVSDITHLDELEKEIGDQKRNLRQWNEWLQGVKEQLTIARNAERTLRKGLQGGQLTKACAALQALEQACRKLANTKSTIPASPRSNAALQTAHNNSDYDPADDGDLLQLWEQIAQAEMRQVRSKWLSFLKKELERLIKIQDEFSEEIEKKMAELNEILEKLDAYVRHVPDRSANPRNQKTYFHFLKEAERIDREDPSVTGHRTRYQGRQRSLERGR